MSLKKQRKKRDIIIEIEWPLTLRAVELYMLKKSQTPVLLYTHEYTCICLSTSRMFCWQRFYIIDKSQQKPAQAIILSKTSVFLPYDGRHLYTDGIYTVQPTAVNYTCRIMCVLIGFFDRHFAAIILRTFVAVALSCARCCSKNVRPVWNDAERRGRFLGIQLQAAAESFG